MKAHLEILSAVVRVGSDTDAYGKPFEFAVALSSVDGKTAVVKALVASGEFGPAHARALAKAIMGSIRGFSHIDWERRK